MSEHNLLQLAFILIIGLIFYIVLLAHERSVYRGLLKRLYMLESNGGALAERDLLYANIQHILNVNIHTIPPDAQA